LGSTRRRIHIVKKTKNSLEEDSGKIQVFWRESLRAKRSRARRKGERG